MLGLLWLLAAAEVLGDSYTLADWTTFLKSIDPSLPLRTAAGTEICYHFDISQTCAGQAAGDLLSLPAIANLTTWGPTTAQCDSILDQQRVYAEKVANSVFSAAIASARTAGVSGFELLAQSWILRVGHYPLVRMYSAIVAALNGISDWTTVHCAGTDILYDSATMEQPDFFSEVDCDVLDNAYVAPLDCSNSGCLLPEAQACCLADVSTPCCIDNYDGLMSYCDTPYCPQAGFCCPYSDFCCPEKPGSACCP
jgi:hypothetical protein